MPDNDLTAILELLKVGRMVTNSKGPIRIIDDISHTFIKGGVYNIVGPSGAGKTSLLRLLNRLDEPTEGKILFHGKPVPEYPPTELRKKISMLFQIPYLFPGTVQFNLEYCCRKTKGHGVDENQKHNLANLLERVGLKSEFAAKDGSELSVGEKQRVAIARALVQEPEVLLLDEPTSALDPSLVQIIEQLILGLVRDLSLTAIVVTHNPDQALRMGGETLLLVGGRLTETGPTDRVLTKPSSELGWKYIRRELV